MTASDENEKCPPKLSDQVPDEIVIKIIEILFGISASAKKCFKIRELPEAEGDSATK